MNNPLTALVRRFSDRDDVRADGGTAERGGSFLDRDVVQAAPFWLPPFLLISLFVYGAILWNMVLSLTDFTGLGSPDYSSLDFENYVVAFQGGTPTWSELTVAPIWNAAQNTVVLMIGFAVVCLILGLLLAILVDQKIRFENTFRTIYLLPMSLSFVVTAKFWLYMYNTETGLINIGLRAIGVGPIEIVQNPDLKLAAVAFALVWQFSGYAMVVYLAGLRAIPTSHFEAARVDGASTIRMYWRIIIPQLRTATVSGPAPPRTSSRHGWSGRPTRTATGPTGRRSRSSSLRWHWRSSRRTSTRSTDEVSYEHTNSHARKGRIAY